MNEEYVKIPVKTTFLEITENPHITVVFPENVFLQKIEFPDLNFYRKIYYEVGNTWGWTGRKMLNNNELQYIIHNPKNAFYLLITNFEICGFFELDCRNENDIELVYMGLRLNFIGKGLGKILLQSAIQTACSFHPQRFWLHTCEYDSKDALSVYQKFGFKIYKTEIHNEFYSKEFLNNFAKK